jgi:hypothetical protein
MQEVIELEAYREGLTLKETLRNLGIPDELVGISGSITESSTASHAYVGSELCTPRSIDGSIETIVEAPGVQV